MTERQLIDALTIKDDIKFLQKELEDINEFFKQWDDLLKLRDDYDNMFADENKEWSLVIKMAERWNDIQEEMKTQIINHVRVKQREISNRIKTLQQKFAKL